MIPSLENFGSRGGFGLPSESDEEEESESEEGGSAEMKDGMEGVGVGSWIGEA